MVSFFVEGVPQPQGSKTAYIVKGKAVVVDKNPKLLKPWRESVAVAAREAWAGMTLISGAVHVGATFYLERPVSVDRDLPFVRPDLDKLVRALLDGITDAGCVWEDDARVVRMAVSKAYAGEGCGPGVDVSVQPV